MTVIMASLRGVIILCVLHLCVQSIEGEVKPAIPDDKFLVQNQQNMATATKDTVWMGFMDIVPVIGTVKESVELVLALYEGNEAVIKEKEKAVENFVKESFKQHVNKSSLPDKQTQPAAAAEFLPDKLPAADQFSGLGNVREVRKESIIEYMGKGAKKGTKPLTPAQKKERQTKLDAINHRMLEHVRSINQNFHQVLQEQKTRSQRGEHVFNNGILRFHSDVLADFIQNRHINNIPGYSQTVMNELGRHTLPQNTATDIQDNMKVHFDEDEFYVNANAEMYGEYVRALREAILAVLNHINPGEVTEEREQDRLWLNHVIDSMNNFQIYVDELARDKWIGNSAARQARFEEVRQEVAHMFNTDRGLDWCDNILGVVRPLYGY